MSKIENGSYLKVDPRKLQSAIEKYISVARTVMEQKQAAFIREYIERENKKPAKKFLFFFTRVQTVCTRDDALKYFHEYESYFPHKYFSVECTFNTQVKSVKDLDDMCKYSIQYHENEEIYLCSADAFLLTFI